MTWVRGLKHLPFYVYPDAFEVAPYVGAWIETSKLLHYRRYHYVAPYVGAWIETKK